MTKLILLFITLVTFNCAELFEKKQSQQEKNNSAISAFLLISSSQCTSTSASSIGGVSRTEYVFSGGNCPTSLPAIGFLGEGVTSGLRGTSPTSRIASSTSFSSSGEKKVNIEVTYTLNAADAYLDVIGNASVVGTIATGPKFRIKTDTLTVFSNLGVESAISTGTPPASAVGTEKTLCLEIHEENGAHFFGWNRACADVTNRATYDFDQENISTSHPGSQIGFVLNNATLRKAIISRGAIGTSGNILEF